MDIAASEEHFRADLAEADANKSREEQIVEVLYHVGNVVNTAGMFPDEEERGEATRRITAYLAKLEDDTPQIPGEAPKLPWKYRELLSYIRRNDMKNFKAAVKSLYEECLKDVNWERCGNSYKFIKTMREADKAGKDVRENRTWQESFMLFVKNFFTIRRREFSNEESFTKEIGFEALGFPPSEVYEEPTSQRSNVDIDAPPPTIGVSTETDYHSVANRWWAQFWAMVGNQ